jgi:hypothetical protein
MESFKPKVNIISGWSGPGGSTLHHISLTNLLNENGFNCTFYGPQRWHLNKCRSGMITNLELDGHSIIISHFLDGISELICRKRILSCHETNLYPLKRLDLENFDVVHYVSDSQRKWHSVEHRYVIIPPIVKDIKWQKPDNKVAGVVGTINSHKQTHKSIESALMDGHKKVLLFGLVSEPAYFNQEIKFYIEKGQAVMMNYVDDREAMYNLVSAVYNNSIRESYGLVEAECRVAGIPYNGSTNEKEIISKEEIFERWEEILNS